MHDSSKNISFILANHNFGPYLKQCLESCIQQCTPEDEIIIVDNGSTDGSRQIIHEYAKHLTAVFQDNLGQGSAIATALAIASKAWIWTIDCDDYLLPNAAASVRKEFRTGISMIYGRRIMVNRSGTPLPRHLQPKPSQVKGDIKFITCSRGTSPLPPTTGLIFRAETMRSFPSIPARLFHRSADEYYRRRAPFYGNVAYTPELIFGYRIHGKNISLKASQLDPILFLREHYFHECVAFHYVKLEAKRHHLPYPSTRGLVDCSHAFLKLFIQKNRGRNIYSAWRQLLKSFSGDPCMHPLKKMCFIIIGTVGVCLPTVLAERLVADIFRWRLHKLSRNIQSSS